MIAMAMDAKEFKTGYTYDDYMSWDEDVRCEIIDGAVYMMAPPKTVHQELLGGIYAHFHSFLKSKPCKVYPAPFGVRLNSKKKNNTVVEPDITIVCDESKIDKDGCNGAPDLIAEILSPSNKRHDTLLKFNLYMEAGVREYWIVDPEEKTVAVYILDNGRYVSNAYGDTDRIAVHVLPGCEIDMKEIFIPEESEE